MKELNTVVTSAKCLMFEYPAEVAHALAQIKAKKEVALSFKLDTQV